MIQRKRAKMIEIPEIEKSERLAINKGLFLWRIYTPIWFMQEHYGEYSTDQFFKEEAKAQEKILINLRIKDPANFFILSARNLMSIYDSDIELRGDDIEATMTVKRCNELEYAMQWSKAVPELNITRDFHCDVCVQSRFRHIAKRMGFRYNVNLTKKGCVMNMRRTS